MTDQITVSREMIRQVLEGIKRSRCTAMIQTLVARIPESGLFGGIAQDLDFAESKLRAALEQPAVEPFGWIKSSEIESSARFGGSINLWRNQYDCDVPLFTTPPPPADVPLLTDEELEEIIAAKSGYGGTNLIGVVRATEQLVRQKAGLK